MLRRTVAAASIVLGLAGIMVSALPSRDGAATHILPGQHSSDPQTHRRDTVTCFNDFSYLNGEENAEFIPAVDCGDVYNLVPGGPAVSYSDSVSHRANRPVISDIEWVHEAFGAGDDAAIADATVVGSVRSVINVACDDTVDYLVDETTPLPVDAFYDPDIVAEPISEQTTAWGIGTGEGGRDETFITDALPPFFVAEVRYRADVNFFTLGTSTGIDLVNPLSLNIVRGTVPWGETKASYHLFGGDVSAPSAQLVLCLDGVWTSHLELGSAALLTNAPTPGLYPMWRTYVSAPGTVNEQSQQLSYITYCKHVGGFLADVDNDCWADAQDTNDGVEDQDSDGLLDGIDLAWVGSAPCPNGGLSPVNTSDCDGDGRTDLEEHFSVTNPREPDTDGDGMLDSGLHVDCNSDGYPDNYTRMNPGPHSGRNRMLFTVMYCLPWGGNTMLGNLGGRPWGNLNAVSEDNCPQHAAVQTNTTNAEPDLDSLPVPGDTNGRFGGSGDATHPDARYAGDICDADDDNDGVPDRVEGAMYFDAGGTGMAFCNLSNIGVPAVTLPQVRDTDGDGSIDGVECALGKNPADPSSKPGVTLTQEQQVFFRLKQLPQYYYPMVDDLDDGSTIGGVAESRGLGPGGGSSNDVDRDGCADEVESVDVDGTRAATIADSLAIARAALGVSNFAPLGSTTAEEIRTADIDFNGSIGIADRLGAARIVLTASLQAIPDYNLNCKEAVIGFDAN